MARLAPGTILLADGAYDADWLRRAIEDVGAAPNIPPTPRRLHKPGFSPVLYEQRNAIERLLRKLKHFRRVAPRYENSAANVLAFVQRASIRIWLRAYESMTESKFRGR